MGWFWNSAKGGAWDLSSVERPWPPGATAIYAHISEHVSPGMQGLTEGGERLPDEKDDGAVKWAAGAMDGVFGHHGGGGSEKSRAKVLHRAIGVVLKDATPVKLGKLYEQLLQDGVLDTIDPLLELIVGDRDLDARRMEELAVWLATRAPDREPVKFAIAVLGVIRDEDHSDLIATLGRHEEFTLYAALALSNRAGGDAERKLFELAQHVDGWGRIHIVKRLAGTSDPAIKTWMLREGFKNSIMYEYLAYTCATVGGLRGELERESVDPAVLAGAGDIIQALIAGGPAQDMDDYADGAVVVERYLHHLGSDPKEVGQLIAANSIQRFLDDTSDWKARETRGWTPTVRTSLRERIVAIRALPQWKERVTAGLASKDPNTFGQADEAAKALGIDTWGHHFARLESGDGDGWYFVMRTDDPGRIDRVISLAERLIPLDKISTGPAEETGLGREWADHSHLDFVLQDLRRFPGKGWPLIRTGIRSPVIRNRHMALRALSAWGKARWPSTAEALLTSTLKDEPTKEVRDEIDLVLAGKQLEDPKIDLEGQ
ncbi:MAG: hypothetical protein H0V17_23350 [Deltaproteobacteria bacterium]|nr:hypothetical protein [Deltaproteobacteria bacterium]